jgi:uncharacterized delta-60 repeat protein
MTKKIEPILKLFGFSVIGMLLLGYTLILSAQSVTVDPTFNPTDLGFGNGDGTNLGIYASAKQNNGKILIGGAFNSYNGTSRNRIARLNADGTLDLSFNPGSGANGDINSIVIQSDNKIVVGGEFTSFNGQIRNRIARLNEDGSLDMSFNSGGGANDNIYSLWVQNDGKILVGGSFTVYDGMVKKYLTRLNADGSLDNSFSIAEGPDSGVYTIAVQNDGKILIGGAFTKYEGTPKNKLARLNSNGTLDGTFNTGNGANGDIYSIAVQNDGKIVIGGGFTVYNGMSRNYITRINSNGSLDGTFNIGTGANNIIYSITIQNDGKILAGGYFFNFNGLNKQYFARLNSDGTVDTSFNPDKVMGGIYTSLQQTDGKIIVCGVFSILSGALIGNILRLNPNGTYDANFNRGTGANGAVSVLRTQSDGKLIIAGKFTSYFGVPKYHMARFFSDGMLDESFDAGILNDKFNSISTVAIQNDGKIIVGGLLYYNNNGVAINVARINSNGSLDAMFNSGTSDDANGEVSAITIQNDGKVIIGGDFTAYGSIDRKNIARLNSNGVLDVTFNPGLGANGKIADIITQSDGKIIICGDFTSYNGVERNHIARLNSDGTLDLTFNPGSAANGFVRKALLTNNGKILIIGNFTAYNGVARNRIARINNDGTLDLSFNPGTGANFSVGDVKIQNDGKIIIAGVFTSFNGVARNRIARINDDGTLDTSFNPGSGANDSVSEFAIQNDGKIVIVGVFTSFNGLGRNRIARLKVCNSTSNIITVSTCDSYTAPDGQVYNTSGVKTAIIPNAAGCDSIITINLTVNQSTSSSMTVSACDSYTAPDGQVYNTSGVKTAIIPNVAGCDSIITINLTVNQSTSSSMTVSACDSYTAPDGQIYNTSGVKTVIIPNVAGCDSIITINLTVKQSTSSSITVSACDSYTAPDGNMYNTSGIITAVINNSVGCDSIILINLTVNKVDVSLSVNDPVITANTSGATYQWIDCDNNFNPIPGANNQIFTATRNGNYAVIIIKDMCSDTSECVQIVSTGTSSMDLNKAIRVYPNPFSNEFVIELDGLPENSKYSIINSVGQIVLQGDLLNRVKVDAANFLSGFYLLRLGNEKSFHIRKIIKH